MFDAKDRASAGYRRIEVLTGPGRRHQWSAGRTAGSGETIGDGAGNLDAGCTGQDVPARRCGEGDGLHAKALEHVQPVRGRWQDLPQQQRSGTSPARCSPGPKAWLFCGSNRGGERAVAMSSKHLSEFGENNPNLA